MRLQNPYKNTSEIYESMNRGIKQPNSRLRRKRKPPVACAASAETIQWLRRGKFQSGAGLVLFMEAKNHLPLIFSQVAFTWITLLTTMGDAFRSIATHCVLMSAVLP